MKTLLPALQSINHYVINRYAHSQWPIMPCLSKSGCDRSLLMYSVHAQPANLGVVLPPCLSVINPWGILPKCIVKEGFGQLRERCSKETGSKNTGSKTWMEVNRAIITDGERLTTIIGETQTGSQRNFVKVTHPHQWGEAGECPREIGTVKNYTRKELRAISHHGKCKG